MSDLPPGPASDDAPDRPSGDAAEIAALSTSDAPGIEPAAADDPTPLAPALDLDLVERDLADVELALARLDAGTYWTDEVSGTPIPDEVLAEQPTARRSGAR